jgi:hypothetical protein
VPRQQHTERRPGQGAGGQLDGQRVAVEQAAQGHDLRGLARVGPVRRLGRPHPRQEAARCRVPVPVVDRPGRPDGGRAVERTRAARGAGELEGVRRARVGGGVERGRPHEDRALEGPQPRAGLDAELPDDGRASAAVRPERLRGAAGPVEGDDEQLPEVLAQRVRGDERAQRGHRSPVEAQPEVGLHADDLRVEPQLLEPRDRRPYDARVGDLAERGAAPEPQGRRRLVAGGGRRPRVDQVPRVDDEPFEADGVDVVRLDLDPVPRGCPDHGHRPRRPTQPGHERLEGVVGVGRTLAVPERLGQPRAVDDGPRLRGQQAEEQRLAAAGHRLDPAAVPDRGRSEHEQGRRPRPPGRDVHLA